MLDLLANKWSALALGALEHGPQRFGALRVRLQGVSPKVLTQTLRRLEDHGVIDRQVFAEVHAVTVRDTVSFHGAWQCFADGRPVDSVGPAAAVKTMLDEWAWWAEALRAARQSHPYAA